ncbi:MAG: PilN domain-containing protein [Alphaproteobacteria bacterium]
MTPALPKDARRIFSRAARLDFLDGLGIAVGQRHVAIAHLGKRLSSVSLQDWTVAALPPIDQAEARAAELERVVSGFVSANGISSERCHLCLPRGVALLSRLVLPAAAKDDLRQVVDFEADRALPIPRADLYWDYLVREAGEKLDVLVVAVPRKVVADHLAALEKAGIRPRSVTITPVALLDLVAFATHGEGAPVATLVDDGGVIELDFVAGNALRTSHLLRPAEVSTAAACERIVAEEAKTAVATDVQSYAWRAGADAAAMLGGADGSLPEELLSRGPDLARRLDDVLSAPDGFFDAPDPTVLPAIGTALGVVREDRAGLNLLPPEERRVGDEGAPVLTFLLASLLVLATLGWLGTAMWKDSHNLGILHERLDELEPQVRQVHHDEDEAKATRDRLKILTQGDQRKISVLLRELTEVIPEDAYLSTFRVRNDRVELEGFARSASDLVPLLEKSKHFRNAQFTSPVTKVQNNQERFSLTTEIEE